MNDLLQEELKRFRELIFNEQSYDYDTYSDLRKTLDGLRKKKKVLLLSCSNRYNLSEDNIDIPKSKMLALFLKDELGDKAVFIDVPDLNIYPCEGNVSRKDGNGCGTKDSLLKDKFKNPTGYHRCWCSFNNEDDELWKISKELFSSDAVIFFGSIRWGQANMFYQKLIERLTWIENRYSTLKEGNIVGDIESGFICVGQNWGGESVVDIQKRVHEFFGFKINDSFYWNWQYTDDENDETQESYRKSFNKFIDNTGI